MPLIRRKGFTALGLTHEQWAKFTPPAERTNRQRLLLACTPLWKAVAAAASTPCSTWDARLVSSLAAECREVRDAEQDLIREVAACYGDLDEHDIASITGLSIEAVAQYVERGAETAESRGN